MSSYQKIHYRKGTYLQGLPIQPEIMYSITTQGMPIKNQDAGKANPHIKNTKQEMAFKFWLFSFLNSLKFSANITGNLPPKASLNLSYKKFD